MKNTFGNNISVTLFGESHGECIGAVLDGMPAGVEIDIDYIKLMLQLRRPQGEISTARHESDDFRLVSGIMNNVTTGTPITVIIPNDNTISKDYAYGSARPGHADYTAFVKYAGHEDFRGGGHFSGRITAALVAVGAIAKNVLEKKNMKIATHISECAGVRDRGFTDLEQDFKKLERSYFAVLDDSAAAKMQHEILRAKSDGDSVGGILETVVCGMPAGVGEPWFDSVESMLSHAMFSIPAVKGVEFGDGFALAKMRGSAVNDPMHFEGNRITTSKNSNGGINGGITNGMPIVMRCVVKPTPTIFMEQETVDFIKKENIVHKSSGRHDPCVVHRARIVVDSVCALVLCDLLATGFGTNYLR